MQNRALEPNQPPNAVGKIEEASAISETLYLYLEELPDVEDHENVQVQGSQVALLKHYAKEVSKLAKSSVIHF